MVVDPSGTLYIAEATAERVQAIHPQNHSLVTVAGNGTAGFNGDGLVATSGELNKPTGVGVDAAGDLLIADTANCRVRVVPTSSGVHFGQSMLAGHIYSMAGTGTCGSDQRDGPATAAQLWNPVAVTVDTKGDVFVVDNGDQSVLEIPVTAGTDYGTTIAAGGIATVIGAGSNGSYIQDGLPAAGDTSELNDPEGVAVAPNGTLYATDGTQHNIKVVPAETATILGRQMNGVTSLVGRWGSCHEGWSIGKWDPLDPDHHGRSGWDSDHIDRLGALQRPFGESGQGDPMSPIDRRTFLTRGAATSAAVLGAGAIPQLDGQAGAAMRGTTDSRIDDALVATSNGGVIAANLTVNGLVNPHGVDPDGCFFAWTLHSSARGARQSGYRIVVQRMSKTALPPIWDSGQVSSTRQAFIAYAGPPLDADASYGWSVEVRDQNGHWSAPAPEATFTTVLRPADWTAQWLQPSATSNQPDRVTYLRSVVTPPPGNLLRATAYISAAHTYQLFVGGQKVDFGPSFSYPEEQYVRTTDVTEQVKAGAPTALGVLHRWYGAGQGRPQSAPGLIMELSLHYANGQHVAYGTDAGWKELPAEWLPSPLRNSDGSDFVEWIDGRAHPSGWSDPAFDDADWTATTVLGPVATPPFGGMVAQRTHISEHIVAPISLRTLASGSVVADFGAIYAARPSVRFANGQNGRTVAMHVGYALDPNGQVSTTHATQGTNLSYSYITRSGQQVFEPLTYLGFRYLQIDNPGESLGRDQISAIVSHAAMPATVPATFSTALPMLDSVWKLNARSCLYCTHEQFVDTPTREKGQFVWDSSNESEAIMRAYGDQNMSWQGLRDVERGQARYWPDGRVKAVYPNGDGGRDIPIFTERYPEWVWRYYLATGDRDTAVAFYPSTSKVAE